MENKYSNVAVIRDPIEVERIAQEFKERHVDAYLFFELLYHTGVIGKAILDKTAAEMIQFCKEYEDFIPYSLAKEIADHNVHKKGTDPFFCSKINPTKPLSKRTLENMFAIIGRDLGYPNLSITTIYRTFYYAYFRAHNYSIEAVKKLYASRNRYCYDLNTFLDYCGVSLEDYLSESKKVIENPKQELIEQCEFIEKSVEQIKGSLDNLSKKDLYQLTTLLPCLTANIEIYLDKTLA